MTDQTTFIRPDAAVLQPPGETTVRDDSISRAVERAAARHKRAVVACRFALLGAWLASWEFASGRYIDPFFSSAPSDVVVRMFDWATSGFIWTHLEATLTEMWLGFLLGAVAGILVAFVLGVRPFIAAVLDPFITAVYSLPKLALAPLFILWFGIGLLSKVVLVALIVFFLVFYNTYAGVRDVDRLYVNSVRIMGGNTWQIYTRVIAPYASTWMFTGIRIAVPYALIGAIVGEFISASRGLGFIIRSSSSYFDTTGMMAGLAYVSAISILTNTAVGRLERRVSRWKASDESTPTHLI